MREDGLEMIWFDTTKAGSQSHRSGLMRVSECLRRELAALPGVSLGRAVWVPRKQAWVNVDTRKPIELGAEDWVLTPEVFSEEERPGIGAWLRAHGHRAAALFHDAIPLRFPEITWPKSVARHPAYMKLLASFGRVFAVSQASAGDLAAYWRWLGLAHTPPVHALVLGADGHGRPRSPCRGRGASREVVMVGIVEPRKNQDLVLDAVEALAADATALTVTFVGRVNPHFGREIVRRMRRMTRAGFCLRYEEALDDRAVAALLERARFVVMPSRAEGCGLPVLEALWAGVPVLATSLPSIVESAEGGGCQLVPADDPAAWVEGMRRMLLDDASIEKLEREAAGRSLPRWADTAASLCAGLR